MKDYKVKRIKIILAALASCILLIAMGFNCFSTNFAVPGQNKLQPLLFFFFLSIMVAICLAVVIARILVRNARQERVVEMQKLHIEHLQEMMRVIRTQRHDFVNHLQSVYGLMQLGEVKEAQSLISDLYKDIKISGEVLRLAVPELTALLMVKTGVAASRNISINIEVLSDLSSLKVRPLDMVAILGNMLNNAIEAVEDIDQPPGEVALRIFEDSRSIVFETHNPGYIPEAIQTKIFEPGFSTKAGGENQGLGLASIASLAQKYKGQVNFVSHPVEGTTFKISFPL